MNKQNMLTFLFGAAFIAAALCLICGCKSEEDDANCIKFENNSRNPVPKGCVPLDFDPDKVDFTAPCQNDGLTICTDSSCYECFGLTCQNGKWVGKRLVIDAGCHYAYCHFKTTAASSNPGDYDCPSYSANERALLDIFAL